MTESTRGLACRCNNYPTKVVTASELTKKKKSMKNVKAGNQLKENVPYVSREGAARKAALSPAKEDETKNRDELYERVLAFIKT